MNSSIDVFHIVYRPFGIEPLIRFSDSYRTHSAGLPHRLTVAFKGFEDHPGDADVFQQVLSNLDYSPVVVPNRGYDIGTYHFLAKRSDADLLCFLNSNSQLLANDWLLKLKQALDVQGAAMAAATGSLESVATDYFRAARIKWRTQPWKALVHLVGGIRSLRFYPAFPNPHLRTNGLLISKDLFLSLSLANPATKHQAMCFESGRQGLTRKVLRAGGKVRVVTSDGLAHDIPEWPKVGPFRLKSQELLLIGDNQTQRYAAATEEERLELSAGAWQGWR